MAKLSSSERNGLREGSFALPGRRYPIPDESHARNALSRVSGNGTPSEQSRVRAAVHRKFPGIGQHAEGGEVEPMDDLKMRAKATALRKICDWMDEEENERLRVTIDVDPHAGPAAENDENGEDEGDGEDTALVQEEEKEAKEHPELDETTVEQIAEDHLHEHPDFARSGKPTPKAEAEPEELATSTPETDDEKAKRTSRLMKLFGK